MQIRRLPLLACSLAILTFSAVASAQSRPVRPRPVNRQHEEWKTQADQAYRVGDFQKSIELTDRVLRADPNDHVAMYLRGSARVDLGAQQSDAELVRNGIADAREAIKIVNRVKIDYYLPYLFGMSRLSSIEGNTRHAETAREVASGLLKMSKVTDVEKANIAFQRAQLDLQLQDNPAALEDFEQATQFEPQHLPAHLSRCDLLLQLNGPDEAELAYADVVKRFPGEPMVFNNRGMFFQSFGRTSEAQADFNRAIELNPEFTFAYTNRAFSRLQAGRFSDALADLNKSIEIDPNQPSAYSLRGTAFLQTGDARAALTDYETALKLHPESPQLRADVGFAQFFGGQYGAALASFDSAQEADPQARFLDPWRATTLVIQGRQSDAEQTFAGLVEKPAADREWFDVLTLLVLGKVTDNETLSAISEGDEQAANAQRCEAMYFIGQRRLADDQPEEAELFFRQALESKAPHLSAYRGAQFALGDFSVTTE